MTDRRRNLFILLLVLGLVAGSVAVLAVKQTRLGLDLQGGVQLIYQAKPTKAQPTVTDEARNRSLDLLRQRVDAFGVAEPEVLITGRDQLEVNLPGVEDADRAADQVGTTAQLFLYDWERNILDEDCKPNDTQINGGQSPITGLFKAVTRASKCPPEVDADNSASGSRFSIFGSNNRALVNGQTFDSEKEAREAAPEAQAESAKVLEIPEGIVVLRDEKAPANSDGVEAPDPDRWWVLRDDPSLSGTDIRNPEQNFDQQRGNEPIVTFDFTDKGRKAFEDTTRAIAVRGLDNRPVGATPDDASQHFAISLDNELVSTPSINFQENPDGIDGVNGAQISGGFTITSAQDLAKILKIGALPLRLDLISRSQVSSTLGKQALNQGLIAGVAGFAIVALFLLAFYRVLGVIATLALGVYAIYLFAIIKLIPITMTLPGIAGLILTLGVAADANIVIFERVKEEIRAGRSVPAGLAAGYKKGFSTILDANVVTLLVAFILFILATAGVKGFAFTLGVGTIVSLFTAVLATQAILLSLRNSRVLGSRSALGASEQKRKITFDFMGASRWFFSASGVILLIGALAIAGKGLNLGIDFESGTRITAPLERSASVDDVRATLEGVSGSLGDAKIQTIDNPDLGQNVVQISTDQLPPDEVTGVRQALEAEFGLVDQGDVQSIGPTFGESVANSALIAIIASLVVIGIYIALRFEWKYAVPVLIALMHDLLITAGVYALVGQEVTTSTVAALLTILGFSLYDTIIVFDRIRENVPRMPNAAFSQIVNRSMSEVVVRSLATSFCTLLPVLALFFFGGETLQAFAFALIVGTFSGTYSSIFIATPVLCHWKEREAVYQSREKRIRGDFGGVVPAYALASGGMPVDVAPPQPRGGRRGRVGIGGDPNDVSREEFDEMVRRLGNVDDGGEPAASSVASPARTPGGRRGSRAAGPAGDGSVPENGESGRRGSRAAGPAGDGSAPVDNGEGGSRSKPKSPAARKTPRKHGRSR